MTLSIDDTIQEKSYSQANGLVAYHWDHTQSRAVKGINFVSALLRDEEASIPLSLQVVEKYWNAEKGAWKVVESRNEIFQQMVQRLTRSGWVDYVLVDSWYASKENMTFVHEQCDTHFIIALKTNRSAAASKKEAQNGNCSPPPDLMLGKRAVKLYFKGLDFPVRVVKKVLGHGDGSSRCVVPGNQ